MESHLKGKTVLLLEATRNFGRATAQALAREGANLFLSTLDGGDRLEPIGRDAAAAGVRVATGRGFAIEASLLPRLP